MLKKLTEQELQKLIEAAQGESHPGDDPDMNEAERWVLATGVKAGDTRVESYHVWYTYRKWTPKPLTLVQFTQQFSKIFPTQKGTTGKYYNLDPAPFDFSMDTKFKMNKELRERRARHKNVRAKKANQKK